MDCRGSMAKIWFEIDKKGITFGKGTQAKLTMGNIRDNAPQKIHHVGEKEAAKIIIGSSAPPYQLLTQISSLQKIISRLHIVPFQNLKWLSSSGSADHDALHC
jgi:hypothetical protein